MVVWWWMTLPPLLKIHCQAVVLWWWVLCLSCARCRGVPTVVWWLQMSSSWCRCVEAAVRWRGTPHWGTLHPVFRVNGSGFWCTAAKGEEDKLEESTEADSKADHHGSHRGLTVLVIRRKYQVEDWADTKDHWEEGGNSQSNLENIATNKDNGKAGNPRTDKAEASSDCQKKCQRVVSIVGDGRDQDQNPTSRLDKSQNYWR